MATSEKWLDATRDYDGSGGQAQRPPERARFAFVGGSAVVSTTELRELLRKRLRLFSLLGAVLVGVNVLAGLAFNGDKFSSLAILFTHPPCYGVMLCTVGIEASLAVLLTWWTAAPLPRLRWLEWAVFAPPTLQLVWNGHFDLTDGLPEIRTGNNRLTMSRSDALPFVLLIVVYGVFIPSTWRRCAGASVLIGAPVVVLDAWALLTGDVAPEHSRLFLTNLCAWLGVAIAIVVYGAHRIEALRNEAVEARKLGQYLLKERRDAGGMGKVRLAEHVFLRRPCAVKLIRPERAGDTKTLLRFEREVRTTSTLTHPNTVQIFDYGHTPDGTFYYVMEYLPGVSLEQLVQRHGPLPAARAVHLLRQVCRALREAHAVGLIHRDIKPANVMVCERGGLYDTAKLLDFGLVIPPGNAPGIEKLTQEGPITGTPAYMSPEQAGGQERIDARSDIYSVGALAYFLLTGQPPFAGRSCVQVLAAHMYEPPAPLTPHGPEVPAELEAIVLKCLDKAPANHYADVRSLDTALAECDTVRSWTEEDAAKWWQFQSGADARAGSSQGHQEDGRTSRCT